MMKRFYPYILFIALFAFALSSCVEEFDRKKALPDDAPGIKLLFTFGNSSTRAGISGTEPGVEDLHENDINSIDYFLYSNSATEGTPAPVSGHVSAQDIIRSNSRDGETLLNAPSYNVNVGDGMLRSLFGGAADSSTCKVYVIANFPGTIDHSGNTSREYLKQLIVNTTFKDTSPSQFVMDGEAIAMCYDRNKTDAAEGIVPMHRIASKITLEVHCVDSVVVENKVLSGQDTIIQKITWEPMLNLMKANMCMGKQSGHLSGEENTSAPTFKYTKTDMIAGDNDVYYSIPFYSYPRTWHNGDEEAPYIKLELPWRKKNGGNQKQFYYKIPLPGQALEKNNWYHIVLNVAIIGGEDFEAGVEIDGKYYVVPWETQLLIQAEAEIVDARYLTVPSNTYTLYNQEELEFLFRSSHDCKIKNVTFTRPNYSSSTVSTTTLLNRQGNSNADTTFVLGTGSGDVLKVENRTVTFRHHLNNVIGKGLDVAPYTITFTLCQEDAMDTYLEEVTIVQEPAIIIEVKQNSGYTANNSVGYTYVNNGNGGFLLYTGDNGAYYNSQNTYNNNMYRTRYECYLGGNPSGLTGAKNQNMYRIKTSVLSNSDYIIGDPRKKAVDNLPAQSGGEWRSSAKPIDGGADRVLTYYHPTDTSEASMFIISPEFQIASNYGSCDANYYSDAQRRCASYQEDGYPAGRWRVPTRAEVHYMITLSQKSLIPQLFTPDDISAGGYWCNSGVIYPLEDAAGTVEYQKFATAESNHYNMNWVRCVYDTWFWENTNYPSIPNTNIANKTTFTWGDLNINI